MSTSGRKFLAVYRGWAIQDVVALVCDHFNVNSNCIHRRTRGNACSEAESLVAFFAFDTLGMTTKAIANYLGMSHQGASKTVARGRVISWSKGITLESLSSEVAGVPWSVAETLIICVAAPFEEAAG